ncbi:hypothetical protein BDV93DRAFT_526958 [Ceratobasidium sp. AG-I]|nr:hypothetical protein BDV93DRAFT_526958 [Ceratobasidium sp. AG-I]
MEAGTSASASSTLDSLTSSGDLSGKKEEQVESQQIEQTEQDEQNDRNDQNDADTVDARTMTDANTLRAGSMVNAEGHDESETRDRTTSGDSEGASTIKATESLAEGSAEAHPPVTRSSTTDLAALTAANTAANRSAGPSTPVESNRPSAPAHQSAPMIAVTAPEGGEAQGDANGVGSSSQGRHTPPSTDEGHSPTPSTWSWGRAMGVLGMNPSGSGSNTDSGARTPKA